MGNLKKHNTKTHIKKKKKSILIRVIRKNKNLLCAIVLFIGIYCYIGVNALLVLIF